MVWLLFAKCLLSTAQCHHLFWMDGMKKDYWCNSTSVHSDQQTCPVGVITLFSLNLYFIKRKWSIKLSESCHNILSLVLWPLFGKLFPRMLKDLRPGSLIYLGGHLCYPWACPILLSPSQRRHHWWEQTEWNVLACPISPTDQHWKPQSETSTKTNYIYSIILL